MQRTLPTGTVTFLFTDIEGSTPLWERFPAEMQHALTRHDQIIREAVEGHAGVIFSSTGDGVAVAFERAADALTAAVTAQGALQREPWPESTTIRVRMGLHTGAAQERGGDYLGPPVNRAARVMGAAHGTQVLVTAATAESIEARDGLAFVDLGEHRLKGLLEATRIFAVRVDGLAWIDRAPASEPVGRGALPVASTEWVGSMNRLREWASSLASVRLLTLTGTGGVGKTRTAIEIAQLALGSFPGGTRFVDLGTIVDPTAVVAATATVLAVQPQPEMSMTDAIIDWLRNRELLLVLDNCEHVIKPIVELVRAIVTLAPTVAVLATSREPLGIAGEQVAVLGTMDPNDAVELFIDRANSAGGALREEGADRSIISAICDRLDRIPLAIELAAARVRSLALADLLAYLDDRFRLLTGPNRGGLERHRTLRATVEWSYDLLSESERAVFVRASVFADGFDLDGANTVCVGEGVSEFDVLDDVIGLVDKSMLIADRSGTTTRYRMLQTLREYANEQLDGRGEATEVHRRFVNYELRLAERACAEWLSPHQVDADAVFDAEWDNLREAIRFATAAGDAIAARRLLVATNPHAFCRLLHEHADWANRLLQLEADPVTSGIATRWSWAQLDYEGLVGNAMRGITSCEPDDHRAAVSRSFLALMYLVTGRTADAVELAPAIWRDVDATEDPYSRILSLFPLALGGLAVAGPGVDDAARIAQGNGIATSVSAAIDRMSSEVDRIGSPSLRSAAAFFRALTMLSSPVPDIDELWATLDAATEFANIADDALWEIQALNVSAAAAVRFGSPDAPARCSAVLERAYDTRFWVIVGQAAPVALAALSNLGRDDAAATIVGGIERHFGIANPLVRELIDRVTEDARTRTGGSKLFTAGNRMDRDELTRFMIAELASI